MTAVFVDSVVERVRELASNPVDGRDLSFLMSAVDAATGPSDLAAAVGATVVSEGPNGKVFAVKRGNIGALLTLDPRSPDRIVVMSVFRAGRDKQGQLVDATIRGPAH
jgi:hypothetical protein